MSLSRWIGRRGRAAVCRDVVRLEHDDNAEEEAEGLQGPDREDTEDLGVNAEVRRTANAARVAPR